MKFIINILTDTYLDRHNLTSFIDSFNQQDNVEFQLVLKRSDDLTPELTAMISEKFKNVQLYDHYSDLKLDAKTQNYWLNLSVADSLLPNAMLQWKTILNRRNTDLLLLESLRNSDNLQKQATSYLSDVNDVQMATIKSVLDIPINLENNKINLKDQLKIFLGLQTYLLMDNKYRYERTFAILNLLGKNVLYQIKKDELKQWDGNFAKLIIKRLVNTSFLLKVNMPTMILNHDDWHLFINELVMLFDNPPAILDQELLSTYQQFVIKKLALAIRQAHKLDDQIDDEQRQKLKAIVKQMSGSMKRQLGLAIPFSFIEQFLERR